MSELTKCLREGRRARKLSQPDVADMAGISSSDYIRFENGFFVPFDNETINRIADAAGMYPGLLPALYRSEFSHELKQLKEGHGTEPDRSGSVKDQSHQEEAENAAVDNEGSPELRSLFRSILSLPEKKQEYIAETIRMVMERVAAGAA